MKNNTIFANRPEEGLSLKLENKNFTLPVHHIETTSMTATVTSDYNVIILPVAFVLLSVFVLFLLFAWQYMGVKSCVRKKFCKKLTASLPSQYVDVNGKENIFELTVKITILNNLIMNLEKEFQPVSMHNLSTSSINLSELNISDSELNSLNSTGAFYGKYTMRKSLQENSLLGMILAVENSTWKTELYQHLYKINGTASVEDANLVIISVWNSYQTETEWSAKIESSISDYLSKFQLETISCAKTSVEECIEKIEAFRNSNIPRTRLVWSLWARKIT